MQSTSSSSRIGRIECDACHPQKVLAVRQPRPALRMAKRCSTATDPDQAVLQVGILAAARRLMSILPDPIDLGHSKHQDQGIRAVHSTSDQTITSLCMDHISLRAALL